MGKERSGNERSVGTADGRNTDWGVLREPEDCVPAGYVPLVPSLLTGGHTCFTMVRA